MKKLLSILLVLVITGSISSTNIVSATTSTAAQSLYQLGLLSNISENEMDMPLNRIVGLTMQLKSIGYKDNDALISQKSHAFTDFTGSYAWGSGWANIGVSNHITAGTSTTKYSPDKIMTKKEFVVGELRVLGYGLEESWSNCAELAIQAGLIHTANDLIDLRFTKSDAAEIMYAALSANIKDSEDLTLIEYLVRDGVVNEEAAKKLKFPSLNVLLVKKITPLTNQIIRLELDQPVDSVPIDDISIKDAYGTELLVSDGGVFDDGYSVNLYTSYQKGYVTHTLVASNKTYTYTSLPIDTVRPKLTAATAITNNQVELTFDDSIDATALNKNLFTINDLIVRQVAYVKDTDNKNVYNKLVLTTDPQLSSKTYTVTVKEIMDWSKNLIDPGSVQKSFVGKSLDTTAPQLSSVVVTSSTTIKVTFTEDLELTQAENINHWNIKGLAVVKAVRQTDKKVVILTTSEQVSGYVYTLEVSSVVDLSGNIIHPSYDTATFYGVGYGLQVLKLLTAYAASNTTVRVIFNYPVTDDTALMEFAYYLGEDLGYPATIKKDTYVTDGTVWILTTKAQSNETYTLDVTGVKDALGNVLSEDYDTVNFNGIP